MRILIEDRNWEVFARADSTFIKHRETGEIYLFAECFKFPECSNMDINHSHDETVIGKKDSSIAMKLFKEGFTEEKQP